MLLLLLLLGRVVMMVMIYTLFNCISFRLLIMKGWVGLSEHGELKVALFYT